MICMFKVIHYCQMMYLRTLEICDMIITYSQNFYSHLKMKDITDADYIARKKRL